MPPKTPKQPGHNRSFLNQETVSPGGSSSSTESPQPGGATASQMAAASDVRVKKEEGEKEEDVGPMDRHSHRFTVRFGKTGKKYVIYCDQPRTVLEAIKSSLNEQYVENKCTDEKLIIQLSEKGTKSIVATHFPCSCVQNDECLIVHCKTEEVEKVPAQRDEIEQNDRYSVFYISREGGENARTKKLFQSSLVKEFDYLCVYAKKGTTVKEALERDGRFVDLQGFKLCEVDKSDEYTVCKQKVDNVDQKKFKICLERRRSDKVQVSNKQPVSVNKAKDESGSAGNAGTMNRRLSEQIQDLIKLMEITLPGDSYQRALELKKENFGKIQQSFSEVHRVRKLLQLGKSVCKLIVQDVCQGTGFVLFDRFILTNAHLLNKRVEGNKLREGTNVYALFNYEEPEPHTDYHTFTAEKTLIDFDLKLGYAILELKPEDQKQNQAAETAKIPPGLLSEFGPPPANGEACLIGHPAGEVKKIDPTCIIEIDNRGQAVGQQLHPYKDKLFVVQSVVEALKQQGIESTLEGGCKADKVVTDNTFMYHGSSGSPVFDVGCRVFGLHTAGYCYGFPEISEKKQSVIEFAQPVLTIFESFVRNLHASGNKELLDRVEKAAEGNSDLQDAIQSVVGLR
ncbi:protein FAM111A-like isoform X2 [Stegastes partitus]|uniref:Protein FAM111A-like isoform X2 n=1 Tax=Stegastes partitus TaxID=144197 RepID=A0A9Y4NPJ5_9TELE|nr:PREDICTED: protein FAM111A-like isoform X2 [Stegastes partitus]